MCRVTSMNTVHASIACAAQYIFTRLGTILSAVFLKKHKDLRLWNVAPPDTSFSSQQQKHLCCRLRVPIFDQVLRHLPIVCSVCILSYIDILPKYD
jgi:hypothetical protein